MRKYRKKISEEGTSQNGPVKTEHAQWVLNAEGDLKTVGMECCLPVVGYFFGWGYKKISGENRMEGLES